jgi:hypothetical protein
MFVDLVKRDARMRSSSIVWSHDSARHALVALIEDAKGRAWSASIQSEPNLPRPRLTTTLFSRAAGEWLSTVMLSSVEEAQAWCEQRLQLE